MLSQSSDGWARAFGPSLKSASFYAVQASVSSEHSSPQNPSIWDSTTILLGRILFIAAILTCGLWLWLRVTAGQKTASTHGLKLADTVIHLPTASFQTLELLLPCAGTLSIEITVQKGNDISVFLVAPDEFAKMKARQTFAHLDGFDANQTGEYRRSGRLSAGRYCLVLMDKPPMTPSSSISDVQVRARLGALK